jgi:hypothetical protein
MLRTLSLVLSASLAFGGIAHAAEGKAAPKPHCEDFSQLKAALTKDKTTAGAKFTELTPGQYHFMAGIYAASPITPPGNPPGDGAQLLTVDGHSGILWTRGKMICMSLIATGKRGDDGRPEVAYMPLPLSPDLLKMLQAVKTGAGEVLPDTSKDLAL